jgi:uncharacterized protein YndB with AHSA1/START domain
VKQGHAELPSMTDGAENAVAPDLSGRPHETACERVVSAQPAAVFRAWTDGMDTWFAAPGTLTTDVCEGGLFFFETRFEGQRHPHYGRFLRLAEDALIEMTWVNAAGTHGEESVVRIELAERDGGTLVRVRHSGLPDEASRKRHDEAWPQVLEVLDEALRAG